MKNNFQDSWLSWQSLYKRNRIKYDEDIWSNIAHHPLDKLLDEFAQLNLGVPTETNNLIEDYVQNNPTLLWELLMYVRRVSLRLASEGNSGDLVLKALGIGSLVSKFEDPRDVLVSVILLNFGATRVGIDIKKWFDKIDSSGISSEDSIYYRATHQTEKSIAITLEMFGPPGW